MENYGLDMKGNTQIESISTLPTWAAADERRVIYVADEDRVYYGSATKWEHFVNNSYYVGEHNKGWLKRPKFEWVNSTTIDIYPGAYHYEGNGTTPSESILYWNDKLTFVLGKTATGGSNNSSEALGNNQWHFIFLHAASINTHGSSELNETCFINSASAPPSLLTTGGYGIYYGTSRAIFAIKTDGSGNILEFFQVGDYIQFATPLTILATYSLAGGTWESPATDLNLPLISNVNLKVQTSWQGVYYNLTGGFYCRPNGQTEDSIYSGVRMGMVSPTNTTFNTNVGLIAGIDGKIEIRYSGSGSEFSYIYLYEDGWYLPDGM